MLVKKSNAGEFSLAARRYGMCSGVFMLAATTYAIPHGFLRFFRHGKRR